MRTSSPHRTNRLLVNVTMLLVVLPFFAVFAEWTFMKLGLAWRSAGQAVADLDVFSTVAIVLPCVGVVVMLWKGWTKTAMGLLVVAYLVLSWSESRSLDDSEYRHIDLVIGARSPVVGADVFCNGVHLGKTPLRISRSEFREKVEPWSKPPRHEWLDVRDDQDDRFTWAKFTWVPCDVFDPYEKHPRHPRHSVSHSHDDTETFRLLKSSRYWWRFQMKGHSGLTTINNFGGGSSSVWSSYLEISVNPQTVYPAMEPHVELLVEVLESDGFRPTPEWIAHFRKNQGLLFLEFHKKARQEPQLRYALDAVVRAEFELPESPTATDCDRVWSKILDRAEEREAFQIPSVESAAIDLMGDAARETVIQRYREEADVIATRYGTSGSGDWEIHRRSGRAARQLPLEYAVKRLLPPELFHRLVYEYSRNKRRFEIVASFRDERAGRLVGRHLQDVEHGRNARYRVGSVLDAVTKVRNPLIEDRIRQFVRQHAVGAHGKHRAVRFVESRIGASEIEQTSLAEWVYHWAPLDERTKLEMLARIDSPKTGHYVRMCGVERDRLKRERLIEHLARRPNPSLDQFVVDTYGWWEGPEGPSYWHQSVGEALAKTDTPAIREFITELWGHEAGRRGLVWKIASTEVDLSHLAWLVPLVEQCSDVSTLRQTPRLLDRIDTPAAQELVERWATESTDDGVRQAAKAMLDQRERREELAEQRLQQYADLLAGKIRPDDLMPPRQAWVWDGDKYVPESP